MKKLSAIFTALALMLCPLTLIACQDDGKTTVKLCEVTHSIFYAPLYIAVNNGYFEDENIDLKLSNGGGADKVMTAVISGSADIGLMGPEATIYAVTSLEPENKNDSQTFLWKSFLPTVFILLRMPHMTYKALDVSFVTSVIIIFKKN